MKHSFFRFILLPLFLALASRASLAQANSQITGMVTDQTGAVVANVTVTLTDPATGVVHNTESSSGGLYTLPGLNPGSYNLKATAKGFQAFAQNSLIVNISATLRSDIKLNVGSETQVVTVEANALQVQSDSNAVGALINQEQISELATNGRNIVSLASLGLGVSANMPDMNPPNGATASSTISFNGLSQNHNIWLIDGGEVYDRGSGGKMPLMPSQDALGEFQVLSSNYPPDYGNASGGTISMAIKNGTQKFHGEAWEFIRNDALQAHNYFDNNSGQKSAKPELRLNIFGANVGGPVFIPRLYNESKQKTFFFYNEEWRRIIQGSSPSPVNTIPSADFISSAHDLTYQIPKFAPSAQTQIYVPTVGDAAFNAKLAADGLTPGQPFPRNVIPGNLMDSNAVALVATGAIPQANAGNDSYQKSFAVPTMVREDLFRVDHKINDKWQLMGHMIHDRASQTAATAMWSSDSYPTVGSTFDSPAWSAVIKLTGSLAPNVLLEASFNYDGATILIAPKGIYAKPSGFGVQSYFTGQNPGNRMPAIHLGTFGTAYDPYDWPWKCVAQDYGENFGVSVTRGEHAMKFGAGYNRFTKLQDIFGRTEGDFIFNDSVDGSGRPTTQLTGDSYVNLLLGLSSTYSQLQAMDARHYVNNTLSAYALDNWHVSPRLSLQYGIRYDALPHVWERNNRLASFDPSTYVPSQAPIINADGSLNTSGPGMQSIGGTTFYMNGMTLAGQYGTPRGLVKNDYNTYQPRLGFSYDVFGGGRTVLRGGVGSFYERLQGNDTYNVAPAPPFSNIPAATSVEFTNPSRNWVTGGTAAHPTFPQGITTLAKNYPAPGVVEYSLGVQHELAPSLVWVVQYVGNLAWHQSVTVPINNYSLATPLDTRWRAGNFQDYLAHHPGTSALTSAQTEALANYPGWGGIGDEANVATGSYNGFQTGLRQDNRHGLTYEIDYTWSHEIDTQSGSGDLNTTTNPWNLKYDKGSGALDRRHLLSVNYVYKLPFFRSATGLRHSALGGWEVAGTAVRESGLPWAGNNAPGGGYSDTVGMGGGYTNRPNFSGKPHYTKGKTTVGGVSGYQWVSAAGFSAPVAAWNGGPNMGFGNAGRDIVTGPGRTNFNTSLYKTIALGERVHFQFRAESFNTFNHTQFNAFHNTVNSSNFGFVTGAQDPRTFEFGGKFVF